MEGADFFVKKTPSLFSIAAYGSGINNEWNIVDFDENGKVLWSERGSQESDKYAITGILPLSGGNYITQGYLANSLINPQSSNMVMQKYNYQHQLIWSDTFSYAKFTSGYGGPMLITHDHKIIIGGLAGGGGVYNKFSFLLLLDTNGKKINYVKYPYNIDSSEQVDHIQQFPNGNIIVESSGDAFYEMYFTLADSSGNTKKRWEFDGTFINGIGGIIPDGDSIFVVTSFDIDAGPLTLIKYDTGFNQIWSKDFDGASSYYNDAGSIIRTLDNGLLLTASRSLIFDRGEPSDMVAIKLDSNGNLAKTDYAGIGNSLSNNRISVYPDPAKDILYFNIPNTNSNISLDVFESWGNRVITMPILSPGSNKVEVSCLSKGLYMYRLSDKAGVYSIGKFEKE